jgi:hypothetical protein
VEEIWIGKKREGKRRRVKRVGCPVGMLVRRCKSSKGRRRQRLLRGVQMMMQVRSVRLWQLMLRCVIKGGMMVWVLMVVKRRPRRKRRWEEWVATAWEMEGHTMDRQMEGHMMEEQSLATVGVTRQLRTLEREKRCTRVRVLVTKMIRRRRVGDRAQGKGMVEGKERRLQGTKGVVRSE